MSIQPSSPDIRLRTVAFAAMLGLTGMLQACGNGEQEAPLPTPPAPTQPMAQDTPPPDYPAELACRQIGGTTVLDVSLAPNGLPVQVTVFKTSGTQALDELAVAAVRKWKFKAATRQGHPAASKLQVPVTFRPPNPPPDECNRYL